MAIGQIVREMLDGMKRTAQSLCIPSDFPSFYHSLIYNLTNYMRPHFFCMEFVLYWYVPYNNVHSLTTLPFE